MAEEIIQENFLPEAQGVYGDPEPKPKSYLKKIHENLIEAYGKDQVPDEAAFTAKMKDTAYARLIHENLVDAFGENEVPDLKLFNSKLINDGDVKKKDGTKVLGFSPYDFLNVGKPSSRTQLPLVGEYSQVQESKAAPKAKESSKDAIQNLLGFIKSGGKPTKGGGKTNQVAKSTQPTVSQNVREQAALGRLGKALVDPVTGTKIDRKTGLPSAYVNELNKKSTFSAPQISEEDKSIYLQSLGLNPNATDVEVLNTPDFRQFKQTVEQEKKINQAIDNYWKRQDAIDMQKRAGFSGPFVSSRTSALGFDEDLRKRLKSGDLVITNDEVTGEPIIGKPDYNPITSFLNLYNKSYDQKAEEKYTQNLSAADKIKHKEVKEYLASLNNEIPSVPSGFFGKLGATAGSFAQALAKPTMTGIGLYATGGTIGAPALGTEAAFAAAKGLQSVGDVVGWMNEIGNDSYEPTWDKVYNGNLKNIENPTYQQKIDAANKATEAANYAKSVGALEGMFFGIPLGSLGSSIKPSVTGYLNTLKSIGRSSLAQMPQMTGASFLGQVGKGEVGRQFGSNETHSQIIQQGLENAWETAKFVGGMGFVHAAQASIPHAFALLTNKAESPSKALTSKAKAIVSKFPEDVVADVYAKAEQEGVIPPGKANEILTDLQSYKESEAQVPKTVVDVDARDAIAGKIQKRDKLDQELKETKVNARKEEIKQEIAQIDAEIDNIYKGDDVLANEYDINGIPLNQDLPAPKQKPSIIPLENVEAAPAEELIRKQQEAPVIEGQQEVVPEQIDLSNFLESVKNKPIEELKMVDDINKANVTVEGTRNGYEVISGEKENRVGDIRQEASEARAKGQDTFTKETVKDGKKIYTLTDATVSDNFGRPGFKSASISFPEGTKVTMEDVMPRLKSELGIKAEVKPTEVKAEVKPTEVEVTEEVKPIRQLGTGSNVYFENNKYRVNDISKGKVILNIEGKEEGGMAIANIEFDNPKEAVEVAKELSKIYPKGIPDAVLIDKVVDNIRNRIKEGIKAEVKPTEVKAEVKTELAPVEEGRTPQVKPLSEFKVGDKFVFATDRDGTERTVVSIDNGIVTYKSKGSKELSSASEIQRLGNDLALLKSDWDKGIRPNEIEFEGSRFKSRIKPTEQQISNLTKELLRVNYMDADLGVKSKGTPGKPGYVESAEEMYRDIAKRYLENDIDIVKTIDILHGGKERLESIINVGAPEKTYQEALKGKQKPFKSSQGNTVELENGKLVVKSKSGEVLSDRASKKAIEEYAENFDYSKGDKAPDVPSEITNSRDAARYVIEESKNPTEIAEIYASEDLLPKESNPKFQAIAEYGLGRIKTSSYKNLGDPNKIEKSMYLKIFSEERGTPIDVLAKSISDKYEGLNIEPQDIVDYIERYSRGDKSALEFKESDVALQAADKFNELTGLDLNSELANKIIDNKLGKANKDQLEIIKEDYETAKQLEDAYWAEYKKTDGFTKESNIGEVDRPEAAQKPEKSLEKAYKDLTNIEKRQIINSKFDKLLEELKIEKICPTD
jgi:hypothetical protein